MKMLSLATTLAAGALVAAAGMNCGDGGRSAEPTVSAPASVQEVYTRMAAAMQRDGQVLHTTATTNSSGGNPFAGTYEAELWLDGAHERARRQVSSTLAGDGGQQRMELAEVIADGGVYRVENGRGGVGKAPTCHNSASPIVSMLLGCHGALEESDTRMGDTETFNGRRAIVVVTEGESRGEDEKFSFTDRLYVDARTWLPLAIETSGTIDYGPKASYETHARYEHEFVDAGSLAPDFFDPASIGYVAADPAAGLAQDVRMTVYWLGREFDPGGQLPKLALRDAHTFAGDVPPGYRATLSYADAADKFGPPIIGMQEFPRSAWDALTSGSHGGNWWEQPGVTSDELALPGGRAVIFRGPSDRQRGSDRFLAHVYLGDTVILVDDFDTPSTYNTAEGFRALAQGLQPYK